MIVSIHQPNYLPWLGFFDKIKRSDLFVIFDDVQFPRGKKHFGHRNQIKTPNGTKWLSVPIKNKSDMVSFNDTIINYDIDWHQEHLRLMELNYKDSPYFNDYYQDLEYIIEGEYESLTELSTDLIRYFMSKLNIRTTIARSSELSSEYQKGSDKIFSILENVNATDYLTGSGPGSQRYIDEEEFKKREISLHWQNYECKEYNQLFGDFIPYLSVVDLLFNHGEKAGEVI